MIGALKRVQRKLRFYYLKCTLQNNEFSIDIKLKHKWFGNDYGGFYIAEAGLNSNSIIYSFGIGEDISFDIAVFNEYSCYVYMFDPTPKSITWIESQNFNKKMTFYPIGIDYKSGMVNFFLPKNPEYVSGSAIQQSNVDKSKIVEVEMKTLKQCAIEMNHKIIDVLKIDIEGSEYQVLNSILNSGIIINQILIEFHSRFFVDGKTKTKKSIELLKTHGYKIFAVSDSFEEVSLIKI